jgi:hypothetical protein
MTEGTIFASESTSEFVMSGTFCGRSSPLPGSGTLPGITIRAGNPDCIFEELIHRAIRHPEARSSAPTPTPNPNEMLPNGHNFESKRTPNER